MTTSPRDRAAAVATLAKHQSKGRNIRWDRNEIDWIHWWQCGCGYEVRTDAALPCWFEEHLADALVAEGLVGDGEVSVEWGVRYPPPHPEPEVGYPVPSESIARFLTEDGTAAVVSRIVTTGPWEVAP